MHGISPWCQLPRKRLCFHQFSALKSDSNQGMGAQMSAVEPRLAEPAGTAAMPADAPAESAWWIIAVAIGWLLLVAVPGFFFGFVRGFAGGIGSPLSPDVGMLLRVMGTLVAGCVLLAASFVRGRIVGQGDVRAGLSDATIARLPLVITLVFLTAAYSALINFAIHSVRPEVAAQFVARSAWLQVPFLFSAVFLAPIAEELFFRGWLWNALKQHWNGLLTASVVSGLWLAVHLEQGMPAVIGLIPVAVLIAFARHFGKSVRASIAVHMAMNLVAAVIPWIVVAYR
jgi:membrane protease YdiL (CAAX protease family)